MSPINATDLDKLSAAITSSMTAGFAQLQTALVSTIEQTRVIVPKATTKAHFLPRGAKASANDLAAKDQRILNIFAKRGFKDVVLRDRNNPSADFNVKPFKLWVESGRVPRKGSKSVFGLFHRDQTDPIPGKASPSPKKGKPQLVKA
jgi:hypothetical protein